MTFTANAAITAAQMNTYLRDNLLETLPAKASANVGSHFVTAGTNVIAERRTVKAQIDTIQTTSSTSYTNLATAGPAVTVTTGTSALAIWSAEFKNSSGSSQIATVRMTVDVTGASSIPGNDTRALCNSAEDDGLHQSMHAVWFDDLTPGSNTFTCKYRVSSGTGTWYSRTLEVMPF
jgi:hypothetical protein